MGNVGVRLWILLVVVVGGGREKKLSVLLLRNRSAFLLRSRSTLLLRSRSAFLLRSRSALLLRCRSALLLYRRRVLGIWVLTFVLVILGVVLFSSVAGCDGCGGGLFMWMVLVGSGVKQELCSCCGAGVYFCCIAGGW